MANNSSKSQLRSLEGILVQMGIISEDDAQAVRRKAGETDGDVAGAVVAERLAGELPLAEAICTHLSLPFMHADQYSVDPEVAESVPTELQKTYHFAVIDRFEGIIVLATAGVLSDEVVSNIEEVKARGGRIIAVVSDEATELQGKVDHLIRVPQTVPALLPVLTTIPLQLLAYHTALLRGADVDQPRNHLC